MQLSFVENRYIGYGVKIINDQQQVILYNHYDDNQYWLPFMKGTLWCAFQDKQEEPPKKKRKKKSTSKKELESSKFYLNDTNYHKKYVVLHPHQSILPFWEWRTIFDAYTGGQDRDPLGTLVTHTNPFKVSGWPGFELDARGEPYEEESQVNNRYAISDWCEKFCSGMYIVKNWNNKVQVVFQYKKDAFLFKLRW